MHLSEFDFFGYSYDSALYRRFEVVVLQGSVGSGTRTIEFGEGTVCRRGLGRS